ncbi:MAG: hypothetical protein NZ483_05570 [Verrucomicrobiae bacterium]|nr:hypothetical protein [Verrucomicrobiae bacterium]
MIQRLDNFLWLRQPDGRLEPFDEAWLSEFLRERLREEAEELIEPMAQGLFEYLQENSGHLPVRLAELDFWVDHLLTCLNLSAPEPADATRAQIRLDELASASGVGFELGFFRELGRCLSEIAHRPRVRVQMTGLRRCVLHLRGQRRWSDGCRQLAREILGFIESHVGLANGMVVAVED